METGGLDEEEGAGPELMLLQPEGSSCEMMRETGGEDPHKLSSSGELCKLVIYDCWCSLIVYLAASEPLRGRNALYLCQTFRCLFWCVVTYSSCQAFKAPPPPFCSSFLYTKTKHKLQIVYCFCPPCVLLLLSESPLSPLMRPHGIHPSPFLLFSYCSPSFIRRIFANKRDESDPLMEYSGCPMLSQNRYN